MTLNDEGLIEEINFSGALLLKHPQKDLIGTLFFRYLTKGSRQIFHAHIQNIINNGTDQDCDLELIKENSSPINIHIKTSISDNEGIKTINMVLIDISQTEQTGVLKKLSQVNRTLLALRHGSYAMIHASDELSYLNDICKILVDDCDYSLVWIGLVDNNNMKVTPMVYAGFEEDYLKKLNINLEDPDYGYGPTGTAVRTGQISICENMITDPKFKPWRNEALKRGYASSIVLPLINEDKVFGALNIYSKKLNPFSKEETKLLKELTGDISYGLSSLRLRIEHEKAEQELKESFKIVERSNAELEQFAYVTSHDLREPLRMISSFLQLLQRRYSDQLDKDGNEFIEYAVNGAKRLDAMINDILLYSRVTNSKEKELAIVDLNTVVQDVSTNLASSIEEFNVEIICESLPSILIDKQLMIQLFQNLISNSIKYKGENSPKIYISVKKEKNQYLFSVKDNGIGIKEKHLERIFTIFQRLHSEQEYEGTGIGLAIVQKIIHQHNGQIWVESEPGKGSTFYFTIPEDR